MCWIDHGSPGWICLPVAAHLPPNRPNTIFRSAGLGPVSLGRLRRAGRGNGPAVAAGLIVLTAAGRGLNAAGASGLRPGVLVPGFRGVRWSREVPRAMGLVRGLKEEL